MHFHFSSPMKFHSSGDNDNDNDNDKNVETTPHTQSEENHLMAYVFVSMCVYVCVATASELTIYSYNCHFAVTYVIKMLINQDKSRTTEREAPRRTRKEIKREENV